VCAKRVTVVASGQTGRYFLCVPKSTVGGLLIADSFSTANCGFGL
jgi:hypothetical protein